MAEETTPTENAAENAGGGIPAGIDPAFWELGKKQYDLSLIHIPSPRD